MARLLSMKFLKPAGGPGRRPGQALLPGQGSGRLLRGKPAHRAHVEGHKVPAVLAVHLPHRGPGPTLRPGMGDFLVKPGHFGLELDDAFDAFEVEPGSRELLGSGAGGLCRDRCTACCRRGSGPGQEALTLVDSQRLGMNPSQFSSYGNHVDSHRLALLSSPGGRLAFASRPRVGFVGTSGHGVWSPNLARNLSPSPAEARASASTARFSSAENLLGTSISKVTSRSPALPARGTP